MLFLYPEIHIIRGNTHYFFPSHFFLRRRMEGAGWEGGGRRQGKRVGERRGGGGWVGRRELVLSLIPLLWTPTFSLLPPPPHVFIFNISPFITFPSFSFPFSFPSFSSFPPLLHPLLSFPFPSLPPSLPVSKSAFTAKTRWEKCR